MKLFDPIFGLFTAAVAGALLAGCESASRKLEDNRGALIGAVVGTGVGLAMKNNASQGERLDIYTGVGVMAGFAAGNSFDEQRRRAAQGISEQDMLKILEQLPDDWDDDWGAPLTLTPRVFEIQPRPLPLPVVTPEAEPPVVDQPQPLPR